MARRDQEEPGLDTDGRPPSRADQYGDPDRAPSFATRVVAAVQNGLEVARFGGLGKRQASPYDVVDDAAHHRLRHYYPDAPAHDGPPVLLIPPLMMTCEVWDVAPESSAVTSLYAEGADPWVVDFGSPEQEEGGLERTLTDHVIAVSDSIGAVKKATGRDVHVMGYSQGGMFAYQAGAYRRSEGMASIVTFGSPVDLHNQLPFDLPADTIADVIERMGKLQADLMPEGIPSWATKLGFQLMDPINTVRQRIDFAMKLYDRGGPATPRGHAPIPGERGLDRVSRSGPRRSDGPARGPQPDAARRFRHRRPDRHPGGSDLSHPGLRRRIGFDRASAFGACDPGRGAPGGLLPDQDSGGPFRPGRGLAFVGDHLAIGRRVAALER